MSITSDAAVVDGKKQNLSGANVKAVTMADGANQPLAIPSAIGGDGSSFSVTANGVAGSLGSVLRALMSTLPTRQAATWCAGLPRRSGAVYVVVIGSSGRSERALIPTAPRAVFSGAPGVHREAEDEGRPGSA